MSRFDPRLPVISQTVLWQRGEYGSWDRYLIREQRNSPPVTSVLTWVPSDLSVCLACLSPNIELIPSDVFEEGEQHCRSCGVTYGIVL